MMKVIVTVDVARVIAALCCEPVSVFDCIRPVILCRE